MNELQKAELINELNSAAHGSLGIYCQTIVNVDGSRTERTEWQNGWNAAVIADSKIKVRLRDFAKAMSDDASIAMLELLKCGALNVVAENNNVVSMYLNMNDTFYYASADDEEVKASELEDIYELYKKYGHSGVTAWSSHKRNELPLDIYITPKFTAALNALKK